MKHLLYSVSYLKAVLSTLPETKRYWVAYSGGMDSCVLLHSLSKLSNEINASVIAAHVNHGLSKNSDEWAEQCRDFCSKLDLDFESIKIAITKNNKESIEAQARELRYDAFRKRVGNNDILLTAHHQDDQAETVLLQLLRGAGPKGLAGIPVIRPFGNGYLARPLLSVTREQLAVYAKQQKLEWIEDESNTDTKFDRNYIRMNIMPVLAGRWPAASGTLLRVAKHQAEVAEILSECGTDDLMKVCHADTNTLEIDKFNQLSFSRKKNLLRIWLHFSNLPVPNSTIIVKIIKELIDVAQDRVPCVCWGGAEVRRYRNRVYCMPPLPEHNPEMVYKWHLTEPLQLDVGKLVAKINKYGGIRADRLENMEVEIRFRQGGERIQPAGKSHKRELKKLFQESGILPWYRDRIPLLFHEGGLVAVTNLWVDADYCANNNEEGWEITLKNKNWSIIEKI